MATSSARMKRCDCCGVGEDEAPIFETVEYHRRWLLFGKKVRVVMYTCAHCNFIW